MKKLVLLLAVVFGVSFVSCTAEQAENAEAAEAEAADAPVEAVAAEDTTAKADTTVEVQPEAAATEAAPEAEAK